jgi:hypothetical protein
MTRPLSHPGPARGRTVLPAPPAGGEARPGMVALLPERVLPLRGGASRQRVPGFRPGDEEGAP